MRAVITLITALFVLHTQAQDRFSAIAITLEAASIDQPGLDGSVELSVSGTPVSEFVRALGLTHSLNISVDPTVRGEVTNTFSNARVSDVLLHLCKQFDLDLELIGSIIALKPYKPPSAPAVQRTAREPVITYDADSGRIDLDLEKDTLATVAKAISLASKSNVVLAPGLETRTVSIFVKGAPLPNAMLQLAFANGLVSERQRDGTFLLTLAPADPPQKAGTRSSGTAQTANDGQLDLKVLDNGNLSIDARACGVSTIIEQASHALGRSFFIYDQIDKAVTLRLEAVSYIDLLNRLLQGTDHTHKFEGGAYLIGKRDLEGLRHTELLRLHHRPVKNVLSAIPEGIKKNVTLTEFMELNGIVASGDALRIDEVKAFLRSVDQVVPVVMIEVMIVDVNRSRTMSAGIKAGLGGGPANSGGALLPGVDYSMNSSTINSLINSFNGFGIFNLGNVASGFYLSIQALETDGALRLRSTPQLSTLNGHEATLSIGQTEFYLEVQNNVIGTQNPTITTSQIYKPIKADLSLKILPVVSSEDMVTLEIEVNQSNFTTRIADTAPPGSVERKFSSIVRAANKDMIILGGLEEKETSRSGSGLPFISRVPVLKWFFGSRTNKNRRSKLTIFIRPTIIY